MSIQFKRLKRIINGNPRYVVLFSTLTGGEISKLKEGYLKIGGKKYKSKKFGEGVAFTTYNLLFTENCIKALFGDYLVM